MVSRRNFFTITTLMFIIFFLCMFSNNLKDMLNDYTSNAYAGTAEDGPSETDVYVPESSGEPGKANVFASRRLAVFIGAEKSKLRDVIWEWVVYSKRDMKAFESLADYEKSVSKEKLPELLVIDSETVDWTAREDVEFLERCVEQGTHLVFSSLPDVSVIADNKRVRDILGINRVVQEETVTAGLHLYDDFFLGGGEIYLPEEADEEEKLVFPGNTDASGQPVFPWYQLTSGTKVYMKGIPEDESVDTEDYPALIWRKSFGTAYVFAVNGGYMEGIQSIGILSAMAAQMHSYEIYPVLNAQNMVLAGYPVLANENSEEMERLYAQSMTQVFREILEPNTWSVLDRYQYKSTCMMAPQTDYSDEELPDGDLLKYYLKLSKEQSAEVGLSSQNVSGLSTVQKLQEDSAFIQDTVGGYDFGSFYAEGLSEKEIQDALKEDILSSVKTVVTDYEEDDVEIIKFLSEHITCQTALDIGLDYTYKGDFLVRSLETALGYLNISCNMMRVAYPENDDDSWEKLLKDFGITVSRYASAFGEFEGTTVSECDMRIRNFLALDYEEERTGGVLHLKISGNEGIVWFVLRTHNEAVKSVEGGNAKKLEEGAYLLEVESDEIMITLGPSDERYYQ